MLHKKKEVLDHLSKRDVEKLYQYALQVSENLKRVGSSDAEEKTLKDEEVSQYGSLR